MTVRGLDKRVGRFKARDDSEEDRSTDASSRASLDFVFSSRSWAQSVSIWPTSRPWAMSQLGMGSVLAPLHADLKLHRIWQPARLTTERRCPLGDYDHARVGFRPSDHGLSARCGGVG